MGDYINIVAQLCHDINRVYCQSLGDDSQPTWDDAPDEIRKSVRSGVIFLMTHSKATPENSHENWLRFKQAAGWIYGEEKCLTKKTHPCMVPYAELSAEQRFKDAFFHTIVRSLT